ncbi:Z1 domain-containing protein [Anabaena cylindrica FACHB-243]|uniref:Endonuclease, Z1 domain-containing protein n=1 Tax=Anabaena cylindrica (strain ATCC 27899 / PCC 7122) TaxID=272123 RepID=K9ZGN8_ANACC|nr:MULTISPECIES: Z1 domain-containing protein [Anabaena]AFZ58398.1 endonuclease, Z1 domain-containing protein [Anabaena cylindrica PCC 7122]MBD2416994.1 Z1 domain-containing protein [Anabaena cylindrica FACHB-243]MBY5280210.1 Z1 domain-containing protein [Anabaena sp. CCAP 1446/1C]MBY5309348.1 Z1 domain-containing protein [Anabaena sp. CCAP 1446/1C]MCM2406531.1 Z1 domain-containing protein [Anabaena sp. CCAP 1446/1C]
MSKTDITTDGYCIDKFIERVKNKIGDIAGEQLKQTAVEVVQNCVDVYSNTFGFGDVGATGINIVTKSHRGQIADGTTGLIYGKVQSGKTNTTIATLALAHANHFRCFIVLTSDNTWLGKQTADRFVNQLKGGPVVFNWEEWRNDRPKDFAESKLLPYIKTRGVVLVSTKNVRHLDNLLQVLKFAKASSVPTLIFDDEADNASLNTNEVKQSKKGKATVPDSSIFVKIGDIRREVANHIYIQITATPQSLLLQNLDHPCKPVFCAALPQPGNSYIGGDLFFEENSQYSCTVQAEELDRLKKQEGENPSNNWDIPSGLKLALCCFFLGSIYKMQSGSENDKYSFLAHICYKKDNHKNLEEIISSFILDVDQAICGESSITKQKEAFKYLEQAYKELSKTALNLPSLNQLIEDLKPELQSVRPKIINANNPDKELKYSPGMNILVGGNRLGRGVTIEGLMVTYYLRDAKQKTMDTVHQHARMFGYRQELLDVTRLFIPQHILEDFRAIHEADEGMRQAIGDDPNNINIQPVWVGSKLEATRSNVLNPAAINAFTPGKAIFPPDPLWKASEIKEHTEVLNKFLEPYTDDDTLHEVDIDLLIQILSHMPSRPAGNYPWEDKRVQEVLKAMKNMAGIQRGRLNVRRGKETKGKGLRLVNRPAKDGLGTWRGTSGFTSPDWVNKAKKDYPDVPTLIVILEEGRKEDYWEGLPFYLPTLILPKSKFVFMFNYSDKSEKIDDTQLE